MIKFFRKIRQKMLNENKFSKYMLYAIGEIILVVIGILIAFQVNEWSNQRHQAKAEEIVLTQLQNDLKKSQIELEKIIDVYQERTKACAIVLRSFWKIEIKRHEESYFRKGKELIFDVMPNTYLSKEDYNNSFEETSPEDLKAYFENELVPMPMDFDNVPFQSDFNDLFQNEKFYLAYKKLYISHYNMYLIYGEILVLTNELLEKLDNVTLLKVDNEVK